MNAGAKLGAYGLVLAAALGGGAALGRAAGPIEIDDAPVHDRHGDVPDQPDPGSDAPRSHPLDAGGLSVSMEGHRLVVEDRLADAGEFAFTIEGPAGEPVTDFDVEHEKRLHLVIASRDLRDYAHLHPEMDDDGRWVADLPVLPAGPYRAFADFRPTGGEATTLGIDLINPGELSVPSPLTPRNVDEIDGYEVHLDGRPVAGRTTTVELDVHLDGQAVTTDPYLGARGHLVALRDGDLGYLHVHPLPEEDDGTVRFAVEVPSPGTYALFFDFSHDGVVRTARFVVDVEQPTTDDASEDHAGEDAGHDDH